MTSVCNGQDKIILSPEKDIISTTVESLKAEIDLHVEIGVRFVDIDLAKVEMIDSIGLGLLISVHNKLKQVDGKLVVFNVSDDIYALFRTMRLNQHFTVLCSETA